MISSRREMFRLTGAGLVSAAALSVIGAARAQVREEAENEPLTIVRKGINKELEVINVDLLEVEAKTRLPEGVYVFIAHGAGEQWTLRENALGADAVAVGRPVSWALTLGGAGGVSGLMDYFNRELVNTMLHLGVDNITSLGREHVQHIGT
jgi:hypothetical protein